MVASLNYEAPPASLIPAPVLVSPQPQPQDFGVQAGGRAETNPHPSVGGDGASAQAATCQALKDAHGDVHERTKVEEQVIERVDRQAARLVSVL